MILFQLFYAEQNRFIASPFLFMLAKTQLLLNETDGIDFDRNKRYCSFVLRTKIQSDTLTFYMIEFSILCLFLFIFR